LTCRPSNRQQLDGLASIRTGAAELTQDGLSEGRRSVIVKDRPVGLSNPEKAVITATRQRFIDKVLKLRFLPTINPNQFNYPIDILGKWQGNRYRFVQSYRSGQPETLDEAYPGRWT
jgi:hypothetical protein